ncbi:hypothetical protein [Acidocella facilis]|uniref:hypothetical protein n=1 Tax=Acidocella facilis TaxID=525 RepID=UPI00047B60CE|nr:hypothetical protein [Acidocella facilis]
MDEAQIRAAQHFQTGRNTGICDAIALVITSLAAATSVEFAQWEKILRNSAAAYDKSPADPHFIAARRDILNAIADAMKGHNLAEFRTACEAANSVPKLRLVPDADT